MYETLFIGKELIKLNQVDSTNTYLKKILASSKNKAEGLTVIAHQQTTGKGQMGNVWESEGGMNLTFSLLLKPSLDVANQFLISKMVSLAIVYFLESLDLEHVKIKWPNDIYVGDMKIAGVLIENTLKGSKMESCVVGVGLNVNQINFSETINNATSLQFVLGKKFDNEELLKQLLFFIEKSYLRLKSLKSLEIDAAYLKELYRFNKNYFYQVGDEKLEAKIIGVSSRGKLQLQFKEEVKEFDLKEVNFL